MLDIRQFQRTYDAADLTGILAQAGSLERGKWADVIAVEGDPSLDLKAMRQVDFVMKNGKVFLKN